MNGAHAAVSPARTFPVRFPEVTTACHDTQPTHLTCFVTAAEHLDNSLVRPNGSDPAAPPGSRRLSTEDAPHPAHPQASEPPGTGRTARLKTCWAIEAASASRACLPTTRIAHQRSSRHPIALGLSQPPGQSFALAAPSATASIHQSIAGGVRYRNSRSFRPPSPRTASGLTPGIRRPI
jgi:hypothetical protein